MGHQLYGIIPIDPYCRFGFQRLHPHQIPHPGRYVVIELREVMMAYGIGFRLHG
jgi:hypothetical protein